MGIGIVTGYTGEPHVTAMDDKIRNNATVGNGEYVFNVGDVMRTEKIDDNTIRIHSGSGIMQGVQFSIQPNDYEDVDVENGTVGYERQDLICIRYEKDETTAVESVSFVVHTGELASYNESVAPYGDLTHGDLMNGDLVNEVAFALVKIHDTTLYSFEKVIKAYDADDSKVFWFGSVDTSDYYSMGVTLRGIQQGKKAQVVIMGLDSKAPCISYVIPEFGAHNSLAKTISGVTYTRYDTSQGNFSPCICDMSIKLTLNYVSGDEYRFVPTGTMEDEVIIEDGAKLSGSNPWVDGASFTDRKRLVTFDYLIIQ